MTALRTHRRLPVIVLAGTLALVAPLMLSGCSLIHLPGSSGGGVSIPGLGSAGTGKLPSDFPSSVPVIKGDIVSGVSLGAGKDKIWNVTVKVSGVSAFDDIKKAFTDAGFTDGGLSGTTADSATGTFTKSDYSALVVVSKVDDKTGWVANYTVSSTTSSNG